MSRQAGLASLFALVLLAAGLPGTSAADPPPSYQVQFLGTGSPVAINRQGVIAGARLVNNSYVPLVSSGGSGWTVLPVPTGADSTFPTDLNDAGVIVGVAYTAWNPVAVRWTPAGLGYTVSVLPRLPGDASSYATAINDLGQIVGARRALGYIPAATTGWLYDGSLGIVDLAARYGLWVVPQDINDRGQIIASTERLDLTSGALGSVGVPPANYDPIAGVALNDEGVVAGTANLRSQSLNIISLFRCSGAATCQMLAGTSRYTSASSINARGDVGYGEQGAGIYLDGLGAFALGSLLAPDVAASGWTVTGSVVKVNDLRMIATNGANPRTGQSGGVLLTPSGTVAPPTAPVLTGVAHPATTQAPWSGISLTWSVSPGSSAYVVERRGPGQATFTALTPATGTIQRMYDDTAVQPEAAYTYRVIALGVAGPSVPSNLVTVTAPRSGADIVAPVVTIVTPARNARVSGTVRIVARASDNIGVVSMDIRSAGGVVLRAVAGSELRYDWSTAGLKRNSTQRLTVRAWDAAGNVGSADVVVVIAR